MNRLLSVLLLACCWTLAAQAQPPRVVVIHLDDTIQPISADYMARAKSTVEPLGITLPEIPTTT